MYINRKEKKISISAEEMLAPMVYYFGEVDAVDFSLLSDYIIQQIKEKYSKYDICINSIKDAYSHNFLFYKAGEHKYKKVYTDNWKHSNKYSSADHGDAIGKKNYILSHVNNPSITFYGWPLRIDVIKLWNLKYKNLLRRVARGNEKKEIFNIVSKYVKIFSKKSYNRKKKEKIEFARKKISNLNILLISHDKKDYDVLVKLGFKNITWFKSIIRAKNYFEKNPDELKNYHMILEGNILFDTSVTEKDDPDRIFIEKCRSICKENGNLYFRFYCCELKENKGEYEISTSQETIKSTSGVTQNFSFNKYIDNGGSISLSENEFLEKMAELLVIKWPDGKIPNLQFNKIEEYINPNILPLPKSISDIKLLVCLYDDFSTLAQKYGLNIETPKTLFEKGLIKPSSENNEEYDYRDFSRYLKENLGEYDIIFTDDLNYYSRNLRIKEGIEQCKDTGRQLTVFVKYRSNNLYYRDNYDHATEIILELEYGEINVPIDLSTNGSTKHIINLLHTEVADYNKKRHLIAEQAIIASLYKYCELLEEISAMKKHGNTTTTKDNATEVSGKIIEFQGPSPIQLPQPTPETLTRTYEVAQEEAWQEYRAKRERDSKNYELINNFDEARNIVKKYLNYVRREIPIDSPVGIKISETEEKMEVQFLNTHDNNRPIGTIIFEKNEPRTGLRNFNIRTLNNSGRLSGNIIPLSIHTSSWEGKEGINPKPNTKESKIIAAHITRICAELSPLIAAAEAARKKEKNTEEEQDSNIIKKPFNKVPDC